ncbi:cobalamin biosynthesis protein CbiX [Salipaludibacillus agaradhaerens]|uniref:Cobalamin biosynthesis protein CbiX n=1 Tax=Salipaludibacillus agaradhaerens TaxID=76935 RepID=A0A9Q4B458_SALAG|nr:CbiX/SirB N-terminal domain-containing protein [Salipaludibacillus agaradhaerens]MCR6097946.1 cobalamin biosynthesis protein CbiX [Salipaludibacillus agaradhaerens]MCR6116425.1 cobalamin biosynthesis protein CbiX [Salipaludibacillus agaradhaerens]
MTKQKGILVIAHGSRNNKWVRLIEESVAKVDTSLPIEIGYLELVEGKSIPEGVKQLEAAGVEEIYVIPYFVCSGSTHLEEIKYALGLIKEPKVDTHLELIKPKATILWGDPMDDHPLIMELLADRLSTLSKDASKESLFLVGHGSDQQDFQSIWQVTLERMCSQLKETFGFTHASYGTILPDTVTQSAKKLSENTDSHLVVVPLFLSEGFYTSTKIPEKLREADIHYSYDGKTYLPHPLINEWLQLKVKQYE